MLGYTHVEGTSLQNCSPSLPGFAREVVAQKYPLPSEAFASHSFAPQFTSRPWTQHRPICEVVRTTSGGQGARVLSSGSFAHYSSIDGGVTPRWRLRSGWVTPHHRILVTNTNTWAAPVVRPSPDAVRVCVLVTHDRPMIQWPSDVWCETKWINPINTITENDIFPLQ